MRLHRGSATTRPCERIINALAGAVAFLMDVGSDSRHVGARARAVWSYKVPTPALNLCRHDVRSVCYLNALMHVPNPSPPLYIAVARRAAYLAVSRSNEQIRRSIGDSKIASKFAR